MIKSLHDESFAVINWPTKDSKEQWLVKISKIDQSYFPVIKMKTIAEFLELRPALVKVVDYLYADEEAHYEESVDKDSHIFNSLEEINNFLIRNQS